MSKRNHLTNFLVIHSFPPTNVIQEITSGNRVTYTYFCYMAWIFLILMLLLIAHRCMCNNVACLTLIIKLTNFLLKISFELIKVLFVYQYYLFIICLSGWCFSVLEWCGRLTTSCHWIPVSWTELGSGSTCTTLFNVWLKKFTIYSLSEFPFSRCTWEINTASDLLNCICI